MMKDYTGLQHYGWGSIINLFIGAICFSIGLGYWSVLIVLAIYIGWEVYQKKFKEGKNTLKQQAIDVLYGFASAFYLFPLLDAYFNCMS